MLLVWLPVFVWMLVNNFQLVEGSSLSSFNIKASPLKLVSSIQPSTAESSLLSSLSASLTTSASSYTSSNTSSVSPWPLSSSSSSSSPPPSSTSSPSSPSSTSSTSSSSQISGNEQRQGCLGDKGVTIAVIENPPYVYVNNNNNNSINDDGAEKRGPIVIGVIVDFLLSNFQMCYQSCPSPLNITWKVVDSFHELLEEITSGRSDIILPLTSRLENNLSWPDYTGSPLNFKDITKASGGALIVDKNHFNQRSKELMLKALFDTWPIFVYTFILAGVSGICIWILESRCNSEEFQSTFLKGWWEGFWWAFVSMTTVGYGDKTPKSVFGRVFGVIWILVGIVMIAMFTATATNALTFINTGIENKKVAVLSSTSASLSASNKGAEPKEYDTFEEMYEALTLKQVDGIFIDQHVGVHYMNENSDKNLRVLTVIEAKFEYSIAMNAQTYKNIDKNVCLKEALAHSSCDRLLQKYSLPMKTFSFSDDYKGLLSSSSEDTIIVMYSLLVVLCAGLVIGSGLELVNNRYPQAINCLRCKNKQHPRESAVDMKTLTARIPYPASFVRRNEMSGSPGIRTQDEINQLTNTNTCLKQLSVQIQSLIEEYNIARLKPTEGIVEQGKMS